MPNRPNFIQHALMAFLVGFAILCVVATFAGPKNQPATADDLAPTRECLGANQTICSDWFHDLRTGSLYTNNPDGSRVYHEGTPEAQAWLCSRYCNGSRLPRPDWSRVGYDFDPKPGAFDGTVEKHPELDSLFASSHELGQAHDLARREKEWAEQAASTPLLEISGLITACKDAWETAAFELGYGRHKSCRTVAVASVRLIKANEIYLPETDESYDQVETQEGNALFFGHRWSNYDFHGKYMPAEARTMTYPAHSDTFARTSEVKERVKRLVGGVPREPKARLSPVLDRLLSSTTYERGEPSLENPAYVGACSTPDRLKAFLIDTSLSISGCEMTRVDGHSFSLLMRNAIGEYDLIRMADGRALYTADVWRK